MTKCFRKSYLKMPRCKNMKRLAKRGEKVREEERTRLQKGMRCFLRGVMREGLEEDIDEVSDSLQGMTILKGGCERESSATLEGMLADINICEKKREKGPTLVWLEKGGDAWKLMTEIGDGKEEKASEARPVTFVNTRIVESKQRMGKRERGEMGGWLNLAKFMGAEGDDHTVDLPLDDDHIVHFVVEEKMHDGNEHPVNEKETLGGSKEMQILEKHPVDLEKENIEVKSCDKVQNDPVHYDMVKHPVYLDENEEIVYSRVEQGNDHTVGNGGDGGPFVIENGEVTLEIGKVDESEEVVIPSVADGHNVAEQVPTGLPESAAEDRKVTTIDREDNTGKEDHHKGGKKKEFTVKGQGQETRVKNRIEQYLIGSPGTSIQTGASGGNKERINKVNRSGTILKTARGKRKTTHFTPSKQKIFNFFERNGDLGSSPALKKKQNPTLQVLPEMAPKARPNQTTGPGSMGGKPLV